MKRIFIAAYAILAISATAFAQPMMVGRGRASAVRPLALSGEYAEAEITALESELGARPIGELTVSEFTGYRARIEAAVRKDAYVRSTARMSMLFPGAGQLRNGDTAEGIGFIAMHAATMAGTLAGAYFLLPSDLRFENLDYLSSSKQDIHDALMSHSLQDYLPAMGVMVAGMIVDMGVRHWSSIAATSGAKAAIESGKARLNPYFGPGYLGMGMHY
ncbi:MAG: hypothetical protein CVV51_01765 [Spirochaetae bacterium HGW-Spirochaetae-7]|jgi:hypothetical protein|nr:MAG: hypothetical protein CVV51_01765 [Spirochaetae bacterium HGW-Spirochaetae-7]